MVASATLFSPIPGVNPPDNSFRRWTIERGWVDAVEAQAFEAEGFKDVPFFTARVTLQGRIGFGAFDGRTGVHLSDFAWPSRPLAVQDAREVLRIHGRRKYELHVKHELEKREASRG